MHSIRIGLTDNSAIRSNLSSFTKQINSSIAKISSGNNQYESESPYIIPFVERLKTATREIAVNIKNIRDSIGAMEMKRDKSALKLDVTHRIRELAVAYNNDSLTDSEKAEIQAQADELGKLLESNDFVVNGSSRVSVNIKGVASESPRDLDVVSTKTINDKEYIVSITGAQRGDEMSLGGLLDSNSSFLNEVKGTAVRYGSSESSLNGESHLFDFSEDGVLDKIDKEIGRYAGSVAEVSNGIFMAEKSLEELQNEKGILGEMLDRYTATDLAEEIRRLSKAGTMREFGVQMLKSHEDLNKHMVLALLTGMHTLNV